MTTEHPFTQYVRTLGRGKTGSRSLALEEARDAMGQVLAGKVEDVQLGAFLMLLRVKEETPEELAGFVQAARAHIAAPPLTADLDWPSYAGKSKQLPWYLLSVLLLSRHGVRVFMHGATGPQAGKCYTEGAMRHLGLPVASSWAEVEFLLAKHSLAYLPTRIFCPRLLQLLELRSLLGLRSPVHSLARLLNPLRCAATVQGIFHPSYGPIHQQASVLLGQPNSAAFKGDGGEPERRPAADLQLHRVANGVAVTEHWPRLAGERFPDSPDLDLQRLVDCWRGESDDRYGDLAVVGTTAIALLVCGHAGDEREAHALAREWWRQRDRDYWP